MEAVGRALLALKSAVAYSLECSLYDNFTTVRAALVSVSALAVLFTTVRVLPTAPGLTMVLTVRSCGAVPVVLAVVWAYGRMVPSKATAAPTGPPVAVGVASAVKVTR